MLVNLNELPNVTEDRELSPAKIWESSVTLSKFAVVMSILVRFGKFANIPAEFWLRYIGSDPVVV